MTHHVLAPCSTPFLAKGIFNEKQNFRRVKNAKETPRKKNQKPEKENVWFPTLSKQIEEPN